MVETLRQLTDEIIAGRRLSSAEAGALLVSDLPELLAQADRLRRHCTGNRVNLCTIINAKSGVCQEDCRFCAQSSHYRTRAPAYPLLDGDVLLEALEKAVGHGAHCFSIVTSGRSASAEEIEAVCAFLRKARGRGVRLAASLGELSREAFRDLRNSGLTRYHHNLETAESFFSSVCTTHTFPERVATLRAAGDEGLELCSGGILGLGESAVQRVELAESLRELGVDSVPLNFLHPIAGTPLGNVPPMAVPEILRSIAVFRFMLPETAISVCGGREVNLRDCQSWIFHAGANGMMVGGYLTTDGRRVEDDIRMVQDLGLRSRD